MESKLAGLSVIIFGSYNNSSSNYVFVMNVLL
jgi:hypothetical protein